MRLKRERYIYIHPWIWRYPRLVTHCSASLRPFLRLFFSFSLPFLLLLLLFIPHSPSPSSRSGCSLFFCTVSPSGSRLTFFSGLVLSSLLFLAFPSCHPRSLPHTTTTTTTTSIITTSYCLLISFRGENTHKKRSILSLLLLFLPPPSQITARHERSRRSSVQSYLCSHCHNSCTGKDSQASCPLLFRDLLDFLTSALP